MGMEGAQQLGYAYRSYLVCYRHLARLDHVRKRNRFGLASPGVACSLGGAGQTRADKEAGLNPFTY